MTFTRPDTALRNHAPEAFRSLTLPDLCAAFARCVLVLIQIGPKIPKVG